MKDELRHEGDEEKNLAVVFGEARDCLNRAVDWVKTQPTDPDVERQFVYTWHLTLMTLARDVSTVAFDSGKNGSLRVARMLNRSLSEYAFRAHQYRMSPYKAKTDGLQAQNMARKIMMPTREHQGLMSDEQYKAFVAYLDAGEAEVNHSSVQKMMQETLTSMKVKDAQRERFAERLEVEYAIGSGLIHGSQAAILEMFSADANGIRLAEQSRLLRRRDEITRTVASLLLLNAAVEFYTRCDFGGRAVVAHLAKVFAEPRLVSVWTQDAMLPLIGIQG